MNGLTIPPWAISSSGWKWLLLKKKETLWCNLSPWGCPTIPGVLMSPTCHLGMTKTGERSSPAWTTLKESLLDARWYSANLTSCTQRAANFRCQNRFLIRWFLLELSSDTHDSGSFKRQLWCLKFFQARTARVPPSEIVIGDMDVQLSWSNLITLARKAVSFNYSKCLKVTWWDQVLESVSKFDHLLKSNALFTGWCSYR